MSRVIKIYTPLRSDDIRSLRAGDEVLLSGTIYTARDQAHLRLVELVKKGKKLPLDLKRLIFYYCGPAPGGKRIIGSCGPTTSNRMDPFTPLLMKYGLAGTIGKGSRSKEVADAIRQYRAVYFVTVGGAGAYLSEKVLSCEIAAFKDLGPEAIYRLQVRDFPLVVAIDSSGKDIYNG